MESTLLISEDFVPLISWCTHDGKCATALLPAKSLCWQPPWPYKPAASQVVGEKSPCPWRKNVWNILKLSWIGLNPGQCSLKQGPDQVAGNPPAECQCSWEVTKNSRWGVRWCNSYCNSCLGGWPLSKLQQTFSSARESLALKTHCCLRSGLRGHISLLQGGLEWVALSSAPAVRLHLWIDQSLITDYWTTLHIKYQHWLLGSACCFSHLGLCSSGALSSCFKATSRKAAEK